MYNDISPEMKDITFIIQVPFEEIWFVQHMIEDMDGLGLVTSGQEKNTLPGSLRVLTTQGRLQEMHELINELKRFIGNLEIIRVEHN